MNTRAAMTSARAFPALFIRRTSLPAAAVWAAAVAYACVASYYSLRRNGAFLSGFDLANFDQALWLLAHGHEPLITQDGRLYWGGHFGISILILTPLYVLGAGAGTLLVVQSLAMAGVAPLLYALARDWGARSWPAALPALLWLASPLTIAPNMFDVHHIPFVAPAIVGSVLALRRDSYVLFAVLALIAMSAKEDVPLLYVMLGVVVAIEGRRRLGAAISASALGVFAFAMALFLPRFGNSLEYFARRFAGDRGDSITDVAVWIVGHPLAALGDLFTVDNVLICVVLIITTGGLCLLAPRWMLLGVPALAHNQLSAYPPQHILEYQYYVPVSLAFSIAAAVGVHKLPKLGSRSRVVAGAGVAIALLALPLSIRHAQTRSAWPTGSTERLAEDSREMIALVPGDAIVAASARLTPHLSHRNAIYTLPMPFFLADFGTNWSAEEMTRRAGQVRWVIVDTAEDLPTETKDLKPLLAILGSRGFHEIARRGSVRLYFRDAFVAAPGEGDD